VSRFSSWVLGIFLLLSAPVVGQNVKDTSKVVKDIFAEMSKPKKATLYSLIPGRFQVKPILENDLFLEKTSLLKALSRMNC